jgi:hypothetical protein
LPEIPKMVDVFDPNPIYDYFLSLTPKTDTKPPFWDLTLNVKFTETSKTSTFFCNKIFFFASCQKFQDLTIHDTLNIEVVDEETFDLIILFIYGGKLKEQYYILEQLLKLLTFSCKYEMISFTRKLELEVSKYLRKRNYNTKFEEYSTFLKNNKLEDLDDEIKAALKHSFNQVYRLCILCLI